MKYKNFKLLLTLLLSGFALQGTAQKKDLQSAKNRLKNKEYAKALEYINLAFETGKLDQSADAWHTKFEIYNGIANNQPDLDPKARQKSYDALVQMLSINPKFALSETADTITAYLNSAYQDSYKQLQNKNYVQSAQSAQNFIDIYRVTKDELFSSAPLLDTFYAQASLIKASAFQGDGDYQESADILEELRKDKNLSTKDQETLYNTLIMDYTELGQDDKVEELFAKAEKEMPGNQFVIQQEINYYNSKGKTDVLLKKLDDAIASNPDNSTYLYYKGIVLTNIAFPEEGDQPTDYVKIAEEASTTLAKAAEQNPDNPDLDYMQGLVYYNLGADVNQKIADAPDSELNKLNRQRSIYFQQALPFMEQAFNTLKSKGAEALTNEERTTMINSGMALKSIYGLDNKTDKIEEVSSILKNFGLR